MDDLANERLRRSRERFRRVTDSSQSTFDHSGNGVYVSLHGFKYDDFNRAGLLSFPKLCKHFESLGRNLWTNLGFDVSPLQLAFVAGVHIEVSEDAYQTASMASKLRMVTKLSNIGNSSFSYHASMINEHSGQVMATKFTELVHINAKSRKTEPLTPIFRQNANRILDGSQLQAPPRLLLPLANKEHCYCCKITVLNSDMDIYYHTTQIKYVDYTLECAARAVESGYYKKLKEDINDYCVKNSSFVHIAESRAHDELLIMTWEDQMNPLLLYFVVTKDEKEICQARMEFYDPYVYSNL